MLCSTRTTNTDLLKVRAQAINPATGQPFYNYKNPWTALAEIYKNEGGFTALYRCVGSSSLRLLTCPWYALPCASHNVCTYMPLAHHLTPRPKRAGVSFPPPSAQSSSRPPSLPPVGICNHTLACSCTAVCCIKEAPAFVRWLPCGSHAGYQVFFVTCRRSMLSQCLGCCETIVQ